MELPHGTDAHAGSFGGEPIAPTPLDVTHDSRKAVATHGMPSIGPPPFWARHLG